MQRPVLLALLSCLLVTSAHAQDWDIAGTYFGSGEGGELTASFEHKQGDIYAVALETVVPEVDGYPGCSGSIAGEMSFSEQGGNFFVENDDYVAGSDGIYGSQQYCEIRMRFDEDGFLNIEEQQGCVAYHGAACEFSAQVVNLNAAG